jgi:N-acetylmuramoyl-L-alanine amidase
MSSRWGGSSESRWSSERERLEQEKRRKEFEAQKPRTRKRASWREGSTSSTPLGPPQPEETPESPIRERRAAETESERQATVGRKWRDSVQPSDEDGAGLPNLPGEDEGDGGSRAGKGILIFGAVLFVLMAIFAFLPFGPLGNDDNDDPSPTLTPPVALVPTAAEQDPNREGGDTSPVVERPADAEFVVCIDPGHGGWDFGRQRQQGDYDQPWFNESEVNLAMALMLRDELNSRGVTVEMTRETGTAVNMFGEDVNGDGRTILDGSQDGDRDELQARINICNAAGADVLVSLHLNGFDDGSARGYEVLYTPAPTREFGDRNLDLATAIYREIGAAYNDVGFETQPRGTVSDETLDAQTHEFGSERNLVLTGPAVNNPDYSIVPSNMPGVIIEPVFITNQEDVNFIVVPENQQILAEAYAEGIMDFFEKHPG